jgi:hypothetical protein
MTSPSDNPLFGGRAPLEFVVQAGIPGLPQPDYRFALKRSYAMKQMAYFVANRFHPTSSSTKIHAGFDVARR